MDGKNHTITHILGRTAIGLLITAFVAWVACELIRL